MIFAQHGPAWKPKMELLLEEKLVQGIIWDVREERVERIQQVSSSNKNYEEIEFIFDPKIYYRQFDNAELKGLDNDIEYMPNEFIDRIFLRDSEKVNLLLDKLIEFQENNKATYYVAPALYVNSFNDRIMEKQIEIWENFGKKVKEKDPENIVLISIMFDESALINNEQHYNDLLEDISNIGADIDGVYAVMNRTEGKQRYSFPVNPLDKVAQFIYDIKNLDMIFIMGYCGIESIIYKAVGADVIGTGWFQSLRKFDKHQKGLVKTEGGGRASKRYFSIALLNELHIEKNMFSLLESDKKILYPIILNDSFLDDKINDNNIDTINMNDTYIQYFFALSQILDNIKNKDDIEERISAVLKIVETAIDNTEKYNEIVGESKVIIKISDSHLTQYREAIKAFCEANTISYKD